MFVYKIKEMLSSLNPGDRIALDATHLMKKETKDSLNVAGHLAGCVFLGFLLAGAAAQLLGIENWMAFLVLFIIGIVAAVFIIFGSSNDMDMS